MEPARATPRERLLAAILALACLALLLTAARIRPDPRGHGTHEQLGLPPCSFALVTGYPCATCGMTTATSLAVRGEPVRAFLTQPAGALLALLAATLFWPAAHVVVFASRLGRLAAPLFVPRTLWIALGVVIASWGYTALTWAS